MIWGRWWEGDSGLGTHVHLWWIHVNVWQNKYSIVKKEKKKEKNKRRHSRNQRTKMDRNG